ncbi:BED-type domain-containing protein [Citrus sinensis]|nr:BED-type domain-containing protein [Citrus sinensis]
MNELHSAEEIYRAEKSLGSINITEKASSSRPKSKGKGRKPSLRHVRIWGSPAHVLKPKADKMDSRSEVCMFVGYPKGIMRGLFYSPQDRKVIVSTHFTSLEEDYMSNFKPKSKVILEELSGDQVDTHLSTPVTKHEEQQQPDDQHKIIPKQPSLLEPRHSGRVMNQEMESMYSNKVWELVEAPNGVKPIRCKWIYKRKRGVDERVETFKVRLVAKGFTQKEGIDYEETFSPVAMLKSIRILLSIVVVLDYEIWQMDVKIAFLNGHLEENICNRIGRKAWAGSSPAQAPNNNEHLHVPAAEQRPASISHQRPTIQQQQQQRASPAFIMENVSESTNLPSNPSVESENIEEEMRSDKKRKQRVVSNCWAHFTKINVGSVAKAKCNHCGMFLSYGSGTSHLNRHTRQIHGFNQPTIEEVFENKQHLVKIESGELGIQKFDPFVARQKLTTIVFKHELPLRFVEYEAFRDFVDYCNPLVKHMSRNTLKSEIFEIYNVEKGKAMNLLEINNSRVAVTTDMWTACNQKKDRKLSTVTLDNCSTNDAMVGRLKELLSTESLILSGNFFHMRCAAHILNLIVKDGLSVIESGITCVRDNVSYWSSSPKRVEKFELACRQMQMDMKKLGLDCPTRWNSTFAMLELAVKYKGVFSRLQTLEPQYKCLPSSEEWELAKQMLDYLRPFSRLTEMFSGTIYPTANLFFPLVYKLRIALKGWQTSDVPAVKNMADNMIGKFLKYWDEISGVLVMAVIFYPRYKMMLINYYYPKIYVVGLENQLKRVRELCDEMMNYYEAKSATMRYGVVGESSTALVVPSNQSHTDFDAIDDMGDFDAYATQNSQSISSKSDFNSRLLVQGGRTLSPHRSRLHSDTLEAIMCSQLWLWATSSGGGVPEEEIFTGEELKDVDEDGPQILD